MGKRNRRRRYMVNWGIQGMLVARTVIYWGFCLLSIILMLFCWRIVAGPPQLFRTHMIEMWNQFGPALLASLILLPLLMVDALRLSNRFVGPIVRLRNALNSLGRGQQVHPLKFRSDDYWHDIADGFNTVLARTDALQNGHAANPEESDNATEAKDSAAPQLA